MSTSFATPRDIANQQLVAYNARDLDAFCALFAEDAILYDLPTGAITAQGMAEIRRIYAARFSSPALHCTVHSKIDLGDFAIDRETVTGVMGGQIDVIAIYEVREGLIRSVRFVRQQG